MSDRGRAQQGRSGERSRVAVVKKYANRRLYNTATSSYVTLEDLGRMVREGEEFVVYDARTGEDITRSVLTQIILEEDAKGRNPLPIGFLRRLIALYDDSMRSLLSRYLELSLENFVRHQEQLRTYMQQALGPFAPPVTPFEELARQNLELFRRAMGMFSPFGGPQAPPAEEAGEEAEEAPAAAPAPGPETEQLAEKVRTLEAQVEELRGQLARLQQEREEAPREPAARRGGGRAGGRTAATAPAAGPSEDAQPAAEAKSVPEPGTPVDRGNGDA
ncbi:hypothetical protein HRbin39_01295 [bacterium HR39]|nr:hypothetical protein HRbin39_01295 [bacterium HR39]